MRGTAARLHVSKPQHQLGNDVALDFIRAAVDRGGPRVEVVAQHRHAVGMADKLWVMVAAVVIAMIIMIVASNPLANFVSAHPTVKMLALSFLLLIGVILIADGFGMHVPKGYIYFALAFSVAVETLNHVVRGRRKRLRAAAGTGT